MVRILYPIHYPGKQQQKKDVGKWVMMPYIVHYLGFGFGFPIEIGLADWTGRDGRAGPYRKHKNICNVYSFYVMFMPWSTVWLDGLGHRYVRGWSGSTKICGWSAIMVFIQKKGNETLKWNILFLLSFLVYYFYVIRVLFHSTFLFLLVFVSEREFLLPTGKGN